MRYISGNHLTSLNNYGNSVNKLITILIYYNQCYR
nr:MAG TPA: hypothetical protein [Bacteriophage sp.]